LKEANKEKISKFSFILYNCSSDAKQLNSKLLNFLPTQLIFCQHKLLASSGQKKKLSNYPNL